MSERYVMTADRMYQIGEVAAATGLSLRTIRHYEEVDLVPPSGRSAGGFRLYTDADIERLHVVKSLKPLEFTLDESREIVEAIDAVRADQPGEASEARIRLGEFAATARRRCEKLRDRLRSAESLTDTLDLIAGGDSQAP